MSNNPNPQSYEYIALKQMLQEQKMMLQMLLPKKASLSYIAQSLGQTNEAVRQYLMRHYEENKDYWKEGRKIIVSQAIAIELLMRGNAK